MGEALPSCERLGQEIRAAGFEAPEWMRTSALETLVPNELLSVLVSRPEFDTYQAELHWVHAGEEVLSDSREPGCGGDGPAVEEAGVARRDVHRRPLERSAMHMEPRTPRS